MILCNGKKKKTKRPSEDEKTRMNLSRTTAKEYTITIANNQKPRYSQYESDANFTDVS